MIDFYIDANAHFHSPCVSVSVDSLMHSFLPAGLLAEKCGQTELVLNRHPASLHDGP